jgi:hypothetical protein
MQTAHTANTASHGGKKMIIRRPRSHGAVIEHCAADPQIRRLSAGRPYMLPPQNTRRGGGSAEHADDAEKREKCPQITQIDTDEGDGRPPLPLFICGIFPLVAFVAFHLTPTPVLTMSLRTPNSELDTRYALPATSYPLRSCRCRLASSRMRNAIVKPLITRELNQKMLNTYLKMCFSGPKKTFRGRAV